MDDGGGWAAAGISVLAAVGKEGPRAWGGAGEYSTIGENSQASISAQQATCICIGFLKHYDQYMNIYKLYISLNYDI